MSLRSISLLMEKVSVNFLPYIWYLSHFSLISKFFSEILFWTSKKQFWEICWKRFAEKADFFAERTKRTVTLCLIENPVCSRFWSGHNKCFLRIPLKNFNKMSERVRSRSENEKKIWVGRFSMRSLGHVQCCFENFVEIFLAKRQIAYVEYPQKVKKFSFCKGKKTQFVLFEKLNAILITRR